MTTTTNPDASAATTAQTPEIKLPNYRIYDGTGGGVTHDIYADSLEEAIDQGRAWIEDGDWSDCAGIDGKRYSVGVPLECSVREIVYYEDLREAVMVALETLQYKRQWLSGDEESVKTTLNGSEDEIVAKLGEIEAVLPEGAEADLGELDGIQRGAGPELSGTVTITWTTGENESETLSGDVHDCSGEYSDTLPDCDQREHSGDGDTQDDEGHVWRQPYSVVGGIKENPGEWGGSGTKTSSLKVCRLCGCYRGESDAGSQRNSGQARAVVTIRDRDEASEAWLKRTHAEEDFIPAWLAEMLGCSPSLKMDATQAKEYIASHDDQDSLDEDDLEHAFAAITGRRADDDDRREGLWSHLNA